MDIAKACFYCNITFWGKSFGCICCSDQCAIELQKGDTFERLHMSRPATVNETMTEIDSIRDTLCGEPCPEMIATYEREIERLERYLLLLDALRG